MKRWIGVLIALPYFCFTQTSSNQSVIPLHSAAFNSKPTTILGLSHLPALHGFQRKTQLGIALENKYQLKELTALNLGIGLPTQHGGLGLHANIQASSLYDHYSIGLNYGHQLNTKTSIGVGFNLAETHLKENGKTSNVSAILGMSYRINEKTILTIHYYYDQYLKQNDSSIKNNREGLSLGIGHQLSKSIFSQIEIDKTSNRLHLLPSILCAINEKLELWCGINKSGHLYLGSNSKLKKSVVGIGLASHPQLGYSLSLQLNHCFNEKN